MAKSIRPLAIYKADLAGVALKPQESRTIAAWLLGRFGIVNDDSWLKLIYRDNEVQIKGRSTLRRQSNLLRARLSLASPGILELVADGNYRETTQACLSAAIKHSRLIADFMDIVLRAERAQGNREIDSYHWRKFLEQCRANDPNMGDWSPATSIRLKTTVFSILCEAGLMTRGRRHVIQDPSYENSVIQALESEREDFCLRCMRYAS